MKNPLCLLMASLFVMATALPGMAAAAALSKPPPAASHKAVVHSTAKTEARHHTAKTSHQLKKKNAKSG